MEEEVTLSGKVVKDYVQDYLRPTYELLTAGPSFPGGPELPGLPGRPCEEPTAAIITDVWL